MTPPLSVLHLISGDLWAGAEVQAFTLLNYLRNQADLEVRAVCLNPGTLASKLQDVGICVDVLDEQRLSSARILLRLGSLLRARRVDVIHTHRYKENVLGAIAGRLAGRPKQVKSVHGLSEVLTTWDSFKMDIYQMLDRAVTDRFCDLVICVSEQIQEVMSKRHPEVKCVCIHNGVDITSCAASRSRESVRRELNVSDAAPMIVFVGRLVPVKGLTFLLESVEQLVKRWPDLTLVIIGDGPERAPLGRKARERGLTDRVMFLGHRADALNLIAAADLFALPSLSEGVPMVILEAMCVKTPIVATHVGGVPEILTHERTALLVDAGNPEQLRHACDQMLSDRAMAGRLAKSAQTYVRENLSAEHMGHRVLEAYRLLAR